MSPGEDLPCENDAPTVQFGAAANFRCEGTGTWWQRLVHGVRRLYARGDWSAYVGDDWPERIMHADVTDDFNAKQGRSTGRWILEAAGKQLAVYLKRHYELPLWHGLCAALWPTGDWSPGMLERTNLEWARAQGLPVHRERQCLLHGPHHRQPPYRPQQSQPCPHLPPTGPP